MSDRKVGDKPVTPERVRAVMNDMGPTLLEGILGACKGKMIKPGLPKGYLVRTARVKATGHNERAKRFTATGLVLGPAGRPWKPTPDKATEQPAEPKQLAPAPSEWVYVEDCGISPGDVLQHFLQDRLSLWTRPSPGEYMTESGGVFWYNETMEPLQVSKEAFPDLERCFPDPTPIHKLMTPIQRDQFGRVTSFGELLPVHGVQARLHRLLVLKREVDAILNPAPPVGMPEIIAFSDPRVVHGNGAIPSGCMNREGWYRRFAEQFVRIALTEGVPANPTKVIEWVRCSPNGAGSSKTSWQHHITTALINRVYAELHDSPEK